MTNAMRREVVLLETSAPKRMTARTDLSAVRVGAAMCVPTSRQHAALLMTVQV